MSWTKRTLARATVPAAVLGGVLVVAMSGPLSGSTKAAEANFIAVGSSSNSANPVCSGKRNESCTSNGSVKSFVVTVGQLPGTGIYPGSWTNLPVTFSNPQSFGITVNRVTASAALLPDQQHPANSCDAGHVSFGVAASMPMQVAAKSTSSPISIPVGLSHEAGNGCKGATFTITVTAEAVNS